MQSTTIQKYKASTTNLKKRAQTVFNAWIRQRDKDESCISCGSRNEIQAGHFYSAGHYPNLRFNEDNCHSQCLRCNYFLSGNLINYRANLEKKIGTERLLILDHLAKNRGVNKADRFLFVEVIEKYSNFAHR